MYHLQKEVGLSYEDIFGGKKVVSTSDGFFKIVSVPSMNAKTFLTYLELMERDAKREKREMKKQKMQQRMKSRGGAM